MKIYKFKTILELNKTFNTELSCIKYLEYLRWGKNNINIKSPFDINSKVYKCKNHKYRCKNTNKYFNVKTGTMFENSKLPLRLWFSAIWLFVNNHKGISSISLSEMLGITQKTSWFMLQRIRNCFENHKELSGIIEIDETYLGCKAENMHMNKRIEKKGIYKKNIVFGMYERDNKQVIAKQVENTKSNTLLPEIYKTIKENSLIITDELNTYKGIGYTYIHRNVNHSNSEYTKRIIHKDKELNINTNSIESFWNLFKRSIYGIYHWTSKKHLQKYINEIVFRFNNNIENRFILNLVNSNHRLRYKQLIRD